MESKKRMKCPKCGKTVKIKETSLNLFGAKKITRVKVYSCVCGEEFATGKMVDNALDLAKTKIKPVHA